MKQIKELVIENTMNKTVWEIYYYSCRISSRHFPCTAGWNCRMFSSLFSVLAVSNQRATGCDNPVADESICEDAEGGSEDSDSSSDDSSSNDNNSPNKSERKMYVISLSHPRGASEPCQRSQMEIYAKIVNGWAANYFHKKDSSQIFYWLLFTPIHSVFLYIHKQPLKVLRKLSYSWKFRKFHRKTPFLQSLSNKYAGLQACYVIKMRPQHKCFPVKFLRTLILKNICKRLLLYIAAVLKTH